MKDLYFIGFLFAVVSVCINSANKKSSFSASEATLSQMETDKRERSEGASVLFSVFGYRILRSDEGRPPPAARRRRAPL